MKKAGIPVLFTSIGGDEIAATSFANQESLQFKRKMKWKIALILQVLKQGYNVLYVDSDVILLRNPLSDLQSRSGFDLLAQKDGNNVCSGFMYILSNNRTIELFSLATELVLTRVMRDQVSVQQALKQKPIPRLLLPSESYPSGDDFFKTYQFYWDMQSDSSV